MATDKDHIEALRNRLMNALRDKQRQRDQEMAEIQAAIDGLDSASKIMTGKFNLSHLTQEKPESGKRSLANRNVTQLVREYVVQEVRGYHNPTVEEFKRDALIDIPRPVKWLKEWSLYSAVHVILKKETAKNPDLHYTKGVGFYKGELPVESLVAGPLEGKGA